MIRQTRKRLKLIALLCTVSMLCGCMNLGPRAVQTGAESVPVLTFSERALSSNAYRSIVELLGVVPGRRQYEIVSALGSAEGLQPVLTIPVGG